MSVKKEASGRRSVQVEVEVPGTPEQVWEVIATGPGISSWFVPAEIREDHTVVLNFGPGMESAAKCTAWDPPHRFATESEGWPPGAPPMATEWSVEAHSGGTCVVRVVHSLFASTDDWDNQLESTESGWPTFFRILKHYLTHFRGQPSAAVHVNAMADGPVSKAWNDLTTGLGLANPAGANRYNTNAGAPALAGIVESTADTEHPHLLLRLDEPAPGAAHITACSMGGPQVFLSASVYLYGDRAKAIAEREEPHWNAWMKERFGG